MSQGLPGFLCTCLARHRPREAPADCRPVMRAGGIQDFRSKLPPCPQLWACGCPQGHSTGPTRASPQPQGCRVDLGDQSLGLPDCRMGTTSWRCDDIDQDWATHFLAVSTPSILVSQWGCHGFVFLGQTLWVPQDRKMAGGFLPPETGAPK